MFLFSHLHPGKVVGEKALLEEFKGETQGEASNVWRDMYQLFYLWSGFILSGFVEKTELVLLLVIISKYSHLMLRHSAIYLFVFFSSVVSLFVFFVFSFT